MKGGSKLFLVAGVGLAVLAIGLLVVGMSGGGGGGKADANNQETKAEQVTVVQAAVAIPAHTLLKAEDLIEVKVASTDAPADAVTSTAEVLNQSYRVPLAQGQTLLRTQTEQPGIRNDIEPGMRAASIPVDAVSMLSGLVQDGDYVDVVFHARIDLVRLLPTTLAETPEDTLYKYSSGDGGNGGNGSGGDNGGNGSGGSNDGITAAQAGPILWIPAGMEYVTHPATGDPGSRFYVRDAGDNLEPVAKIIVQDVKVLRVVRPGESFSADGTLAGQSIGTDAPAPSSNDEKNPGYLILQVTPAQAEAITFMQDKANQHTYQVIVRGKDDHALVETTGITFQILMTDAEWSMPWPQTVLAPKTQVKSKATATPSTAATPQASNS
jgi:Flp pilus assembly protein CpaB